MAKSYFNGTQEVWDDDGSYSKRLFKKGDLVEVLKGKIFPG
jgi:hypothetical protein